MPVIARLISERKTVKHAEVITSQLVQDELRTAPITESGSDVNHFDGYRPVTSNVYDRRPERDSARVPALRHRTCRDCAVLF